MIISVANVDLNVLRRFVKERTESWWLIKSRAEGLSVLQRSYWVTPAQPRENLVSEGVDNFHFVVISIGHQDYVFFWDEVNTERVLKFGFSCNAVFVSIRV